MDWMINAMWARIGWFIGEIITAVLVLVSIFAVMLIYGAWSSRKARIKAEGDK